MHKMSVSFQIFWRFYNHSYRSQMANSANNWWFHSYSHKKKTTRGKLSEAKTMCTIVVKAFKDIPAVPVMHALCTHDQNGMDIEACIQLITAALSMHNIRESYASVMPD